MLIAPLSRWPSDMWTVCAFWGLGFAALAYLIYKLAERM